jgi:putative intracellular protease/amidase
MQARIPFAAALLLLLLAAPAALSASTDPAIPTLAEVVGHDFGAEITSPEGIATYLAALHRAAPERSRLVEYARSWEGRPLHFLLVGSPERIADLDATRAGLARLADPRGLGAGEAEALLARLPVVTWLVHAVHGNEISSSDAALRLAHHLLARRGDPEVELVLRESLVLIDPLQNPDGRARFLAHHLAARAALPDPEPWAVEHDEPWPSGRSNHYLFDMNRDWFALTQPETRGRIRVALEWFPHVAVDLHEMGGEETYFFPPPAVPENPHISAAQKRWLETFGRANAERFDARGFPYFVREIFDSFYPGYGESWPFFQGAIGKTFEQASAGGLVYRRRDESLLTYARGVEQHFTAAFETALTAARHREGILRDYLDFRRSALAAGGGPAEYALVAGADPSRTARLARLLAAQGIEVRRALEPVRAGARTLPAGTWLVTAAQPAGKLVRNLLDERTALDPAFVAEQERRRRERLPDQIYDVTAWSLPLLFDVEVVTATAPVAARTVPVAAESEPGAATLPAARVGYLVPWGAAAASTVFAALDEGLRGHVAGEGFVLGGRRYDVGTALFRTAENGPELGTRLGELAARHGAEVVAVDSGWVDAGISLGSSEMRPLRRPRILLAWDAPAWSLSAGWARWMIERRYELAATTVRTASLGQVDLARYDVLVLPGGDYSRELGEDARRKLRDWIERGGTLVTLAEASRWAAKGRGDLLATTTELRSGAPDLPEAETPADGGSAAAEPFDYEKAIAPERERPESVPGAILRVELDREHWLAAGTDGEIQTVVWGRRVFSPIPLDRGRNVGVYAAQERLVASGLVWRESLEQLPRKAFLIHQPIGEGHLVAFAEDPNFRGYAEGTALLFVNALLLGPAF